MGINVDTDTGSTVAISAGLPTTYDDNISTGYASLTFTDVGEIIDMGEVAKVWSIVNHPTVGRAYDQKIKDKYDISDAPITIGKYDSDAGQVILQTALNSSASFSFEVTRPSGKVSNFTGKIVKAGMSGLSSSAISMTNVSISIDSESLFEA